MRKFFVYIRSTVISLPVDLQIIQDDRAFSQDDYPLCDFLGCVEAKSYDDAIQKLKKQLKLTLKGMSEL